LENSGEQSSFNSHLRFNCSMASTEAPLTGAFFQFSFEIQQ